MKIPAPNDESILFPEKKQVIRRIDHNRYNNR